MSATTAFNKNSKCYKIKTEEKDLISTFSKYKNFIIEKVSDHLKKYKTVKWYIAILTEVVKSSMKKATPFFHGKMRETIILDKIEEQYSI